MRVEVDQSGKLGDTRVPTVLAFSNGESYSIVIPATVKRECFALLKRHYRLLRQPYLKLFAAGLFLLLKRHLPRVAVVVIDQEYIGQEGNIKGMLLNYIRKEYPDFPKENIVFRRIGKRSPAHRKAYATYVGEIEADHKVEREELLALSGRQKRSGDSG